MTVQRWTRSNITTSKADEFVAYGDYLELQRELGILQDRIAWYVNHLGTAQGCSCLHTSSPQPQSPKLERRANSPNNKHGHD